MYAGSNRIHSVIFGAVDIVEAQEHTFVRCWFKGTIIQTVPLPLRSTEAVDMVETQREFSRSHVYWFKKTASFFYRDTFSFAAPRERELSTWSNRSHVYTLFERAGSLFRDRRSCRYCRNVVHISDVCMLCLLYTSPSPRDS